MYPSLTLLSECPTQRCVSHTCASHRNSSPLFRPYIRTLDHRNSFKWAIVDYWNQVPKEVATLKSAAAFTRTSPYCNILLPPTSVVVLLSLFCCFCFSSCFVLFFWKAFVLATYRRLVGSIRVCYYIKFFLKKLTSGKHLESL